MKNPYSKHQLRHKGKTLTTPYPSTSGTPGQPSMVYYCPSLDAKSLQYLMDLGTSQLGFSFFRLFFFLFLILLRSVSTSQVACRCRSHIVMIRYINILSIVLRHQKISSGHRKSSSLGGVWPESCICAFFIFQSSLASRLSTFAAVAARFFGSGGTGGIRSCK